VQEAEEMIGTSDSMHLIFSTIRKVATNDYPVLITGESGTGKEVTAKAIHERSARKNMPFLPINCGAIPETLLESELFGHERGAFTGAVQQKKGRVEAAQGGTLFLDEIGELPLTVQVKLLRFLQDRVVERVGGQRQIKLDVRIIAATNVDLKQAIISGSFREDLFYRLGVMHIHLPPLRERGEDVLLMATRFLVEVSQQLRRRKTGFTHEAIQAIQDYPWPGNVRELTNKIRRAVVMAEGLYITPQDLDLPFEPTAQMKPWAPSLKSARQRVEGDLLAVAMAQNQGNLSRVAHELKISRPTLYRLLSKYKLLPKSSSCDQTPKGWAV
jgi:two-component system NtrC family response regulator